MKIDAKLKEKILHFLNTDTIFRRKVVKIIVSDEEGPVTKTYLDTQLARQSEEFEKKLAKQSEDLKKYTDNALAKQGEELKKYTNDALAKQSEEFDIKLAKQSEDLKNFIRAIGSRWGLSNEKSIREGLKKIIEERYKGKVKKWEKEIVIPQVHPKKAKYEVDVVIVNGVHTLVEIKSSVGEAELELFYLNCLGYEYVEKVKVDKKILIGTIREEEKERVKSLAKSYGIEVTFS